MSISKLPLQQKNWIYFIYSLRAFYLFASTSNFSNYIEIQFVYFFVGLFKLNIKLFICLYLFVFVQKYVITACNISLNRTDNTLRIILIRKLNGLIFNCT